MSRFFSKDPTVTYVLSTNYISKKILLQFYLSKTCGIYYIPWIYRDKTMADLLMYIPKFFCILQLVKQQIKIRQMSQKYLSQRIRQRYNKTFGTSVIIRPLSPPSLIAFFTVLTYIICLIRNYYCKILSLIIMFRFNQKMSNLCKTYLK